MYDVIIPVFFINIPQLATSMLVMFLCSWSCP